MITPIPTRGSPGGSISAPPSGLPARSGAVGVIRILALMLTIFVTAMSAHAHVVSIGYVNAGPGAVTFWYGSYHQPGETPSFATEGTMTLVGINGNPFPSTTVPFSLFATALPSGLVAGVNNTYLSGYNDASNHRWQGSTFTGLAAGSYRFTYNPIARPTATWSPLGGLTSSTVSVSVAQLIAAPVANAGPDVTVNPGNSVSLNGNGSYDLNTPALPIISYAWTQLSGVAVTLSGANTATPSFTAPPVPPAGATLVFKLSASNGQSVNPGTDTVNVYVRGNLPPVANAGANRSVFDTDNNDVPTIVTLDGSASFDPEGAPLAYVWTQTGGPAVALQNVAIATPSFVAPDMHDHLGGTPPPIDLTFHLKVSDGTLTTETDVMIRVTHNNQSPVANASATNPTAPEGTVTLNGYLSSDADQDSLTYSWSQVGGTQVAISPNGTNASSSSFDYQINTEHSNESELLSFILTVSDGIASNSTPVSVFVQNVNHAPVAAVSPVAPVFDNVGLVALNGSASDEDGDTVNLHWQQLTGPPVTLNNATTGDPSFIAPLVSPAQGSVTLTFQLIANDSDGPGDNAALDSIPMTVDVLVKHANRAPVADAGQNKDVPEETAVALDGSASYDPDQDQITYAWTQTGGVYVGLDTTDPAHPTFISPSVGPLGAALTFELIVTDNGAAAAAAAAPAGPAPAAGPSGRLSSAPSTVVITVNYVNQPPVAVAAPVAACNEGTGVSLDGSQSSDPDDNAFTYWWTQVSGPDVVGLSSATDAMPTFTAPAVDRLGATVVFELKTTDEFGAVSNVATTSIVINNVNQAPVADAGMLQTVFEDTNVGLAGLGIDQDSEEQALLTYAWVQTEGPTVLLLNATTPNPSFHAPVVTGGGDPNAKVKLKFALTVTDPNHASGSATTTVCVANVDHAPTANAGGIITTNESYNNSAVVVTLNGADSTDPDNDPLGFAWVQTSGPAVVLANANTANPSFTAPFVNAAGATLKFKLTVKDPWGGVSVDTATVVVVNNNTPPTLSNARASIGELWPPNHNMVKVSILGVVDPNNNAAITITGVTQDEATNGLGDGDTAIDALINADGSVLLRAERSGKGNGRVYHIHFTASDFESQASGTNVSGVVNVSVPHGKKGDVAIDGGELFDSTH